MELWLSEEQQGFFGFVSTAFYRLANSPSSRTPQGRGAVLDQIVLAYVLLGLLKTSRAAAITCQVDMV